MSVMKILDNLEQGSQEWLDLRKTKITATDAPIIMGASHWKTKLQLYREKTSNVKQLYMNEKMQRGILLEPEARMLFSIETGILMQPKVVVKDWAMASLDGMSQCGQYIVEIKCPGEKDHAVAASGKIPDHYYPQIQHQLYVTDLPFSYYYSFDGIEGILVRVERDDIYIEKMVQEEKKFYECLINQTLPELSENDYLVRDDTLWQVYASQWKELVEEKRNLEIKEQELRNQLIYLSCEANTRGCGISVCQVNRKGNVDYSRIPELKNVNLDLYRRESTNCWRITAE